MNLFNKKQPTKSEVAKLIDESNKHKSVFQSTADNLKLTNEKIDEEYDRLQLEIQSSKLQQDSLQIVKNENAKIVEKIRAFLED